MIEIKDGYTYEIITNSNARYFTQARINNGITEFNCHGQWFTFLDCDVKDVREVGCLTSNTQAQREEFQPEKASRLNAGKAQLSYLLDAPVAMKGLAEVFAMGAEKYERDNWKKGLDKGEIIDSLLRHLMAYKNGELVDSESGKCHTHHIHWNALVLAEQHSNK